MSSASSLSHELLVRQQQHRWWYDDYAQQHSRHALQHGAGHVQQHVVSHLQQYGNGQQLGGQRLEQRCGPRSSAEAGSAN